ncbi:hypothetical protein LOAG_06703 [Loa loa]|uniref:Uncharacterized protein n=1 Tax=Loa loa TaxID=7209 RepID=A0A1S0TX44_LOALO|nr:hypothetical protein LOAG_06703 [Loa loa]EFO21783.1 hypothetical protein LOAG_06703 [Loa loa]
MDQKDMDILDGFGLSLSLFSVFEKCLKEVRAWSAINLHQIVGYPFRPMAVETMYHLSWQDYSGHDKKPVMLDFFLLDGMTASLFLHYKTLGLILSFYCVWMNDGQ